ncbi:MAG: deoxyribodipyrimidine photo-lyase [Bdellovibrionales bacterium]
MEDYGIHWFRRDLRVAGNSALLYNWKKNKGRVVGVFCFDSQFLSRPDFSHNRFAFFLKTLKALKKELQEIGSDLLMVNQLPEVFFLSLNTDVQQPPHLITWNRDYEPFACDRDKKIENTLFKMSLPHHVERDHLLLEPEEVLKVSCDSYQVFSAYAKRWYSLLHTDEVQERLQRQTAGIQYLGRAERKKNFSLQWKDVLKKPKRDALELFERKNQQKVTILIPDGGSHEAFKALDWFRSRLPYYEKLRDFPSESGTSRLSMYLKNGSLTTAQIIHYLDLGKQSFESTESSNKFLKELVWREFYYSILYHHPRVETEAFIGKYKKIKWVNNKILFKSWCRGETGYPIVDAGMRELNTTGWMHNRVRMIVASFLTKDLLIDWRLGEKYFMKQLLDGDLAPNNGNWQWAASTGCDAQPYFRIFNPLLQSQKFDPDGSYIRKFVPELRHLSDKEIHNPTLESRKKYRYSLPVVSHEIQKKKAIKLFDI